MEFQLISILYHLLECLPCRCENHYTYCEHENDLAKLMRFFLGIIGLLCTLMIVAIGLSIFYGKRVPAPLVEWASITLYLHDTRTGVNYRVLQPRPARGGLANSGVQFSRSPNDINHMTIMSNATGLDVRISNREGESIASLSSNEEDSLLNVVWLDDETLLIMTVFGSSGDFDVARFNVMTLKRESIGRYNNSSFILSPDRNWLLVSERSTDLTEVLNVWNERRLPISTISTSFAWSANGRYFAARAVSDNRLAFQMLDTTTGTIITDSILPHRLLWSSNNYDLIAHNDHDLVVFRHHDVVFRSNIEDTIVRVQWSPDGLYAAIITEGTSEYQLFLVDLSSATPMRLLNTIPQNVQISSIAWAVDTSELTYILNQPNSNVSPVYRVQITDGTSERITFIPSRIRQIRYIEQLSNYGGLP